MTREHRRFLSPKQAALCEFPDKIIMEMMGQPAIAISQEIAYKCGTKSMCSPRTHVKVTCVILGNTGLENDCKLVN